MQKRNKNLLNQLGSQLEEKVPFNFIYTKKMEFVPGDKTSRKKFVYSDFHNTEMYVTSINYKPTSRIVRNLDKLIEK